MAENRLKIRICRMLRSSLRSCKSKDQISDVVSTHHHHRRKHHQLVELFSPKPHPLILSPAAEETLFLTQKPATSFLSPDMSGRKCPPASPIISPLTNFYDFPKHKIKPKNKKKARAITYRNCAAGLEDQFPDCKYVNGLFSSDEDEDEDEEKWRLSAASRRRTETLAVAVVKQSSDPYNDFRTSMVEMIVERDIYAAKDLENLLRCFLTLNSYHHHKVIIQVFAEIWEAFFYNPI